MGTYGPFPRDAEGKIIVGPLPLIETSAIEEAPPAAAPAPPDEEMVGAQGSGNPPPRRVGTTPTPFGQLRPAAIATASTRFPADWLPWLIAGLLLALATWVLLTGGLTGGLPPQAAATSAAAALASATLPDPGAAPTVTPTGAALTRAIVAYDAPGGVPIGAMEPGRPYQVIEERDGWRQLMMTPGGAIWARAWEMDGLPPPTLTPTAPPPSPVPVVPERPAYQPPPPAVRCKDVILDGAYLGPACGRTDDEIWAEAARLTEAAGAQLVPTARP